MTTPDTHQLEDVDSQHKKDVDRFISDLAKKDRSSQKLSTIINHNKQVARSRSPPPADPRRRMSRDAPAASSKDRGPRNMVKDGQAPGGEHYLNFWLLFTERKDIAPFFMCLGFDLASFSRPDVALHDWFT